MIFADAAALYLLAALAIDAVIGDPKWLWKHIPHPVALAGMLTSWLDRSLNRANQSPLTRRCAGVLAVCLLVLAAAAIGMVITLITRSSGIPGAIFEIAIVAVMLAMRSLFDHVSAVQTAFSSGGLPAARTAVSMIVGRDPQALDTAGVCRASIESAAENLSDGVVAPAFWYLVAGLPGLLAYKMTNTADSMIGHRTPRHEAFGWASARLDDLVNLLPARITAVLIAFSAPLNGGSIFSALKIAWRDAPGHRSPNAGWPEAAMASVLGVALAGPRTYGGKLLDDHWMFPEGRRSATPDDIGRACRALIGAGFLLAALAAALALTAFALSP
jgi:adenosylcobinamide-phosphate synthase